MMAGRTITVTINDDGDASVQVDGVKGPACQKLTDALIGALVANKARDTTVKQCAEFHLQNGTRVVGQAPIQMHL